MNYKHSGSNNFIRGSYNRDRIIIGYFIIVLAATGLITIARYIIQELKWIY